MALQSAIYWRYHTSKPLTKYNNMCFQSPLSTEDSMLLNHIRILRCFQRLLSAEDSMPLNHIKYINRCNQSPLSSKPYQNRCFKVCYLPKLAGFWTMSNIRIGVFKVHYLLMIAGFWTISNISIGIFSLLSTEDDMPLNHIKYINRCNQSLQSPEDRGLLNQIRIGVFKVHYLLNTAGF